MPMSRRNLAKVHVEILKKVSLHSQKMPVANYERRFATSIQKKKNTGPTNQPPTTRNETFGRRVV